MLESEISEGETETSANSIQQATTEEEENSVVDLVLADPNSPFFKEQSCRLKEPPIKYRSIFTMSDLPFESCVIDREEEELSEIVIEIKYCFFEDIDKFSATIAFLLGVLISFFLVYYYTKMYPEILFFLFESEFQYLFGIFIVIAEVVFYKSLNRYCSHRYIRIKK